MFEEFKFVGKKLFEEGLVGAYGSSLSIREKDKIIITKQGAILSDLRDDDIMEVPVQGEANKEASVDLLIHRLIYSSCEISAVIHANPAYAGGLAVHEEKIAPQDFDTKQVLKTIPVVRVRDPFSQDEMSRFLIPTFKNCYRFSMIRGFGGFAVAGTLLEAYQYTSLAEKACKIIAISKSVEPKPIKKEERTKPAYRSAIPPSIGVMDRSYRGKR